MKIYLVWYRLPNETEDRIRAAAKNWSQAERMADNLAFYLGLDHNNFEYGVKSYEINVLPADLENDDGSLNKWGPEDFGE